MSAVARTPFTIQIPVELKEWIREYGAAHGLPMSGVIVRALNELRREEQIREAEFRHIIRGSEEKKRVKRSRSSASRFMPDDFSVTDDMRQWALEDFPHVDVDFETAKMRDFEFKTPRSDWGRAWRNWVRTAGERAAQNGTGKSPKVKGECQHPAGRIPIGFDDNDEKVWACSHCNEIVPE